MSSWIGQGWEVATKFAVNLTYNYSEISQPSPSAYHAGQLIGSVTYDVDTDRSISGRLVNQYGATNLYLACCQKVRAGLDVYVLFGDPNATSTNRSITIKLIEPIL